MSKICACSLESQIYSGLHEKKHGQQVKRDDSSPLLSREPTWSIVSFSEGANTRA